ncbi:MAG: hypothetical protein R6U32_07745 [Candidatus Woesearchaeota archaeon]
MRKTAACFTTAGDGEEARMFRGRFESRIEDGKLFLPEQYHAPVVKDPSLSDVIVADAPSNPFISIVPAGYPEQHTGISTSIMDYRQIYRTDMMICGTGCRELAVKIPHEMRDARGLEDRAVVMGLAGMITVWEPEEMKRYMRQAEKNYPASRDLVARIRTGMYIGRETYKGST